MALEGIVLNAGSGGQKLATDTVAGFDFQIIKIGVGADDSTPTSVSDANPMPVDDAGGSLTVDNAGTFAVQADTVTPGTAAANLGKAEDAVHASGDTGVMGLAVRKATPANLSGTDGDYEPLQIAAGRLWTSATIDAALPAGTNAIGKLAANSGVDIGDVDVLSVIAGTGATNLGKAIDAVAGASDTGVAVLAIRDDALSALTPIEGDYVPLRVSSTGALHVTGAAGVSEFNEDAAASGGEAGNISLGVRRDADTTPVSADGDFHTLVFDGSGNLKVNVKAGAAGGVTHIDDAVFTPGTDDMTPIGGMFDDTAPDSIDEGDAGVVRMSANRNLYATLRDAAGNERGVNVDASNRLTVSVDNNLVLGAGTAAFGKLSANSGVDIGDVDVTSVTPGTAAANLGKAEDAVHASGDTGIMALAVRKATPADLSGADGDYEPLQIDNGRLWASVTVDAALPAGTNAIGKLAANSGVDIGDVDVTSVIPGTGATNLGKAIDTAFGGTDTGIAALAVRDDTLATLTPADGDYVPLRVSSTGALHVTGSAGVTEYNEDDATPAPIVGSATLMERDDGLTTVTPAEGDWIAFRGTAEGALWVQDFNSDTISSNTTTLAGAVSGSEMQVDVVAALPAGTNAIGKLAANSGVDIGDVDVLSVVPGTGATSLGKAEDAVHGSGDTGVMALAVRNDVLAALAGTDGDYAPLQVNASGALFIQEGAALDVSAATLTVNAHAVTNAGTFVVQEDGAALTALQLIDDPVFADDAAFTLASSKVSMAGAIRDDALSTLTAIEGDAVPLRVNSTGALHVTGAAGVTEFNEDAASAGGEAGNLALGVRRDADTTPVSADGDFHTMVFDATGNLKVDLVTALPAGTNTIGKLGAAPGVNIGEVNIITALPSGTNEIGKLAANSGVDIGDVDVTSIIPGTGATNLGKAEDAVHGSGDSGVMALAVRNDTLAALAGTDGDYAPLQVNASGALFTEVATQPARASTTDAIKSVLATDTIMDGTTAEVPIYVVFDVSSSGDNQIVAGVASNKIRVLSLAMNAFGDVEAEFQSGSTTTNLSGTFDLGTSAGKAKGLVLAFSPIGHFESASGTALDLNLNAAIQVSGHVVYIVVAA